MCREIVVNSGGSRVWVIKSDPTPYSQKSSNSSPEKICLKKFQPSDGDRETEKK